MIVKYSTVHNHRMNSSAVVRKGKTMNDLISRRAAIEAMRKAKDKSELHRMLVQLPSAQPTGTNTVQVEDCISRAAVVDTIEGVDWYHQNENGEMVHGANSAEHQAWYNAEDIYKAIEGVPSAQPDVSDTNVGKMCEYYDLCRNGRDEKKLREELLSAQSDIPGINVIIDTIKNAINASTGNEAYMVGLRNGMRWCWSALTDKEPEYEDMPPAQPWWIPCSRELPKPNEEDGNGFYKAYLVQDGRWMDVARWDGKYWIAWGYSTVLLNVMAWMPLPKPWEGEKYDG